ncbi:MAG: HEAT repeat domain-containing protein [Planctomycetota bacterium]
MPNSRPNRVSFTNISATTIKFAAIVSLTILAACQTTVNGRSIERPSDDEFPNMSPFVEEQIIKRIDEIPYLRGRQVVDACAAIAKIGPGAIPKLQKAANDSDPMRRTFVMNVLGAIGDRRALKTLHDALNDSESSVRYEAARSCTKMGDWPAGIPVLIAGLSDSSQYSRTLCHDSLRRNTNLDFGYNPKGSDVERNAAAIQWQNWWKSHEPATIELRR